MLDICLLSAHDDTGNGGDERHEAIYIPAADIKYLPVKVKITATKSVTVDYATVGQIPQAYKLLDDCCQRGDNVAIEEFDYESWERNVATHSWVFSVMSSGEMVGVILLRPTRHGRSIIPGTAELFIHMREDYSKDGFVPLVQLSERLALDLKLNYFTLMYSVFYCNQYMVFGLRSLGYTINAIIPNCGRVKGVGIMETCIMTRVIGPIIPVRLF